VSAAGAVTAGVCDGGSGGAPGETAGADVGADPLNGYLVIIKVGCGRTTSFQILYPFACLLNKSKKFLMLHTMFVQLLLNCI
jgi:hypothetical protein